ncbi:MAG: Coenzyme F420 hydrogenase/dehydrogenase, beta subunit C-terminal domain [Pseudomonadota bacterium]
MSSEYLQDLQTGLSPNERLYQIIEHGMCIGCGLCQSLVGEKKLTIQEVASGYERPVIHGELKHQHVDDIMDVCPGTRVEGLPVRLLEKDSHNDEVWGVYRDIYFSYSAEAAVRHMASTGGVLTALALYLVESKTVDFVLHAKASTTNPTFGEATISRTREDVLTAAGSRYGPTATLKDFVEVLDQAEQSSEKFAFIGTPCDVNALRNYAGMDKRVHLYCTHMLVMVCGGFMAPKNLQDFLAGNQIDHQHIQTLRYRGYGCPGATRIEMDDGTVHEFSYLDFWGDDDSLWGLPPRCKVCPDGIGDAADIAASDTWDGGAPTVEESATDLGSNAAIVRTLAGEQLMDAAIEAGYLVRGDALTPEDMNRFQPHQEVKKRAVGARFDGMRAAGNIVPDTRGLRIGQLQKLNEAEINQEAAAGAKLRVENGKFKENRPE